MGIDCSRRLDEDQSALRVRVEEIRRTVPLFHQAIDSTKDEEGVGRIRAHAAYV